MPTTYIFRSKSIYSKLFFFSHVVIPSYLKRLRLFALFFWDIFLSLGLWCQGTMKPSLELMYPIRVSKKEVKVLGVMWVVDRI